MSATGSTEELTAVAEPETLAVGSCPYCGEPRGERFALAHPLISDRPVDRCARCSGRFTIDDGPVCRVATCGSCALVFLREGIDDDPARCPDCEGGRAAATLVDRDVARAGEGELVAALARRWRLLTGPGLDAYLAGVARRLAREMAGSAVAPRIVLFDDAEVRALALPSGLVLVSLGVLDSVADEAELAFVVAHEMAHAREDADRGLVRLGTWRTQRRDADPWLDAATDILALGYGDDRERIADGRALAAMRAAGYDPEACLRWLDRVGDAWRAGDSRVREHCMAHPAPSDRARRLRSLGARTSIAAATRVNREVFRRAAGPDARAQLEPLDRLPLSAAGDEDGGRAPRTSRYLALAAAILLLAVLAWYVVLA